MKRLTLLISLLLTLILPVQIVLPVQGWASWTKVGENTSSASNTVQLTTVSAHDVIAVCVMSETDDSTISISDGTTTLTPGDKATDTGIPITSQMHYLLDSVATGTVTYTVTWGTTPAFHSILAYRFTTTGTPSLDAKVANTVSSSLNPTSTNISPDGTDNVTLGCWADGSGEAESDPEVNNVNADGSIATTGMMWYRTHTSGFTGAVDVTQGAASNGVISALSLESAAGGGPSGPPVGSLSLMGVGR